MLTNLKARITTRPPSWFNHQAKYTEQKQWCCFEAPAVVLATPEQRKDVAQIHTMLNKSTSMESNNSGKHVTDAKRCGSQSD